MAITYGAYLSDAAKAQVDNINSLANSAQQKYSDATSQYREGLTTLQNADPSASTAKMREYGTKIADIAGGLTGYSDTIKGLAGDFTTNAATLTDSGNSILGIGTDLANMNRDSSNEYVRTLLGNIDQYNPNDLASLAGQDVNSSYDTAEGQLLRNMSRSGVNVSSGRSAALQQQLQIARNTAKAAAMTRARLSGLQLQTSALKDLASIGQSYSNQGKDFLVSAGNLTANAVGAQQAAAEIETNSAALFGNSASIEQSAANLDLGYANSVTSQQNTIAAALQKEGAVLDAQSARELNFYDSQLKNTWNVSSVVSSSDDYDPWEATGHSSTYWKNNLSADQYNNLASNMAVLAASVQK